MILRNRQPNSGTKPTCPTWVTQKKTKKFVSSISDQREYKTGEYRNLTNEQKEELKEWRANNPNTFKAGSKKAKKEAPKKSKSSMKKQVASLVEAALNKSVKIDDQVNDEEKYIMSMVQAAVTKTLNQKNDQQSKEKPQVTLKSILKHAKNNGNS